MNNKPLTNKSQVSNRQKNSSNEAPENSSRPNHVPAMRNSISSSSFIEELHSKLRRAESTLKTKIERDSNNNGSSRVNLNAQEQQSVVQININGESATTVDSEPNLKKMFLQRTQENGVPEWKKQLMEKKRKSKSDLNILW